jgi:hypothetical protein
MVGLPPPGYSYRIIAHDRPLGSYGGDGQATTPAGVSLRRFSSVSYLDAIPVFVALLHSCRQTENPIHMTAVQHD